MVEISNLTKEYPNKTLFKNYSYRFKDKGLYLISASSGKGKTTLLNMIKGYDKDYKGKIVRDSCFYFKINQGLINELTVKENIKIIKDLYKTRKIKLRYQINEFKDKKVKNLSLGERQRLLIYICMIVSCKVILLDEPLAYLDSKNSKKVINDINKLASKKLVIVVSHSLEGFKNYIKVDLDNSFKFTSKIELKKDDKIKVNKLKYVCLLIKLNVINILLFILASFMLINSYLVVKNKTSLLKESFDNSYYKGNLLYKENTSINNYYLEVLTSLNKEIEYDFTSIYSKKMYKDKVYIQDKYLDNGFLFSLVYKSKYLDSNQVIVSLDFNKFCTNNNFNYCNEKIIKDRYLYKTLFYKSENRNLSFKIMDIISGENCLYFSEDYNIIDSLKDIFKNDYTINNFIKIKEDKIDDFKVKINSIESLLNYDFIYNDNLIYYVKKSDKAYFSYQELDKSNLIGCNNNLISCSSFSLFKINSLKYIDNYKINDIYFKKVDKKLNENELIISKELLLKLNKKINDKIDLKFYIDDSLYLKEFVIKDVIDESKNIIYQNSEFSHLDLLNRVNRVSRFTYAYGNSLDYKSRDLLDSEIVNYSKSFLNEFIKIINISLNVLMILLVLLMFYLEFKKTNKIYPLLYLLKYNGVSNYLQIGLAYYLIYLFVGIFIIFKSIEFFIIYLVIYLGFYLFRKRKIQVALD